MIGLSARLSNSVKSFGQQTIVKIRKKLKIVGRSGTIIATKNCSKDKVLLICKVHSNRVCALYYLIFFIWNLAFQ